MRRLYFHIQQGNIGKQLHPWILIPCCLFLYFFNYFPFFFLKKSWTNNESSIISKGQNPKIRISCSAHTSRKPESSLQTFTVTCQQAWMKLPAVRVAVVWHTQITAIYLSLRICEAKTKTRPPAEWSPWNKTAICCDYEAGALFKDRTCILSTCPGYRVAPVRARGRF